MIRYKTTDWISLIFKSYNREILSKLLPSLALIGLYTAAIIFFLFDYWQVDFLSTTAVHSILGIVLGLFLVFRMNSAYDRWWEGRVQWGNLVVSSRNLAYKLNAFIPAGDPSREWFKTMVTNFPLALKEHLREGVKFEELRYPNEKIEEELRSSSNVPGTIVNFLYEKLNSHLKTGMITGDQLIVLDKELSVLPQVQGSCERIKNTPIPYSYSMYLKKFLFTFLITLPFAFASEFLYVTIPIVMFLFFILVSIELISEEIEDPFGLDDNDLPTDELTLKIMKDVIKTFERDSLDIHKPKSEASQL